MVVAPRNAASSSGFWQPGGSANPHGAGRIFAAATTFSLRILRRAKSLTRWQVAGMLLIVTLALGWLFDSRLFALSREKPVRFATGGFREMGQQFGEPVGISFLALAIWVLDPVRRRGLLGILLTALLAGLTASGAKVLIGRERPKASNGQTVVHGPRWPDEFDAGFPSGHTAAAFALTFGLIRLYPRGRYVFLFYATSCGISRVLSSAHFLTDAIAGGWLGWEIARITWHTDWMRTVFPTDGASAPNTQSCIPETIERSAPRAVPVASPPCAFDV
jgi:membrane-associated phospholipid phosphatase